jgi:hypothetical protein
MEIGSSLLEEDKIDIAASILEQGGQKWFCRLIA